MNNIAKFKITSEIAYFLAFLASLYILFFMQGQKFMLFGIDCSINKQSGTMLCLANFTMLLFMSISKNNTREIRNIFYPLSIIVLFSVNMLILTDNIIAILAFLFTIFLIYYFTNKSKPCLFIDSTIIFICIGLLSYGSLRYFALNEVPATFENLLKFQNHDENITLLLSFFALLLPVFRLFNFIPFKIDTENTFLSGFYSIIYLIIGSDILIKIFGLFAYQIYKIQYILAIYFILNAIYQVFIQFSSKNLSEFLTSTLSANISIGIFSLFLYNETGFVSYIYYMIVTILSYTAGFILTNIIDNKMGNCNVSYFKKINHNNRLIKFFIIFIFLNLAKLPPLAGFFATIYSFLNIFLIDLPNKIMVLSPYILFLCTFLISINTLRIMAKILVEPTRPLRNFLISNKQYFIMFLICTTIFVSAIFIQFIINYYYKTISIGIS